MILHVWIDCSQNFGERWRERMKKVGWSRRLHKTTFINVWVSKIMINLDSINSDIYSEITFLRWDIIISKKNSSRFYTTFLKSVKCRTILVLTFFSQKGRKKIRPSDSENVKWKMINPWNPFNAVRSIAADLKARRFEGHLTHRKIARRKLRVKAFVAVLWVVMYEGLLLLTKILLFPAA